VNSKVVKLKPKAEQRGTNGERALWTFLMVTLVAPFLAAVVILLASVISGYIGRGPASLLALDRASQLAWAAQKAVETYVWSALPAGVGGAILAGIVYARGSAPWLAAATLGAVPVSVMAMLAGGMMAQHLTPMAFIGAVVGIAMWAILRRARILT
jgi:hypothetical protein